jgi:hypothetical protein
MTHKFIRITAPRRHDPARDIYELGFAGRSGYDHFIGKQKSGGAVAELHQVHPAAEVFDLADDTRLFVKPAAPFMVAHRLKQAASPAR